MLFDMNPQLVENEFILPTLSLLDDKVSGWQKQDVFKSFMLLTGASVELRFTAGKLYEWVVYLDPQT